MASYTALMNIQVDSQQAQLGINNLNKNLTYLSRSSRLTNKSLLQMQQTFLRIENTINQATGNTAAFNGKMQQATNIIKKLRGEVSTLRSEIDKLNQKLKGTNGPLDKQRTLWERLSGALQKNQYFTSLAISAFAGFVNQRLIGGIIKITDEYTLMENKIKTVTPTVDGVARSMESVYRIAQETRQPLSIVANLYSRIGRNSKELQQNLTALVDITSTVSKAFQLGGATIEESRNAMVQFSQALASGRLQGDELRSILELAPVLATSISKSIGITTGSLRRLASEGLITTEVLIKALLEAGKDIRAEFDNFVPTVSQSAETVVNAFTRLIGSNQKFKDANETLGNQLRKFASALDEQGDLANTLGDAYLFLARNVDVLAAAFAGLAVIVGGAAIAGLFALLASVPWVGIATGIGAVAASIGGFALASASAEEETSKLIEGTESLLKVLSDTDMKALSEKNVADIQADIMGKQAGIQRLISETSLALKDINEDLKETEQYNAIEKILGSDPKFARLLAPGASLLYKDENALKQEKALKEQRLEMLRNLSKELKIEYDNIAEAEQEGALKAMLARTRALEMQKRQLKNQERQEQLSYYASMGSGVSDRGLQDIQFANKAAQNLRKELSKLQMASLNTAFVGMFSVDKLFGGTDPAAAVDNINNKMKEFTKITEKDAAGGIVEFFTKYLGKGGPEGEAAIKEITEKLTKEPFLAKNLREAMISVWQAAAAEYEVYAAKRKAEEERYLNDLLKDMRYEYQEMAAENTSDRARLMAYLQDGVTLHNKEALAIHYKISLEKALQRLQMEKEERSEDAIIAAEQEIEKRRVLYENILRTKNTEEAVNKILQNRETIFENQSRARAEVSVGGPESYGGATGMDGIGSSIRDANIEYQMQIDLIDRIYDKGNYLSLELKKQEATIRDQNVQRVIANKLETERLSIEKLKQEAYFVRLQSEMKQSGATDLEVELRLIEEKTNLELSSYATMLLTDKITDDQYQKLKNITIEKDRQLKQLAEEEAKRRALEQYGGAGKVGEAAIKGILALFDKDFYKGLYDGLVSGTKYLIDGIKAIDWENFADYFSDKIKGIDWKGIATNLGEWFKSSSGLLDALASAGGASGQRTLGISKAAAAGATVGGPIGGAVFALGQAILSNEKVQAALSRLFDAVFKFIDPFLDLLGPVIDIFTAFLENNPIMTAINALKPLLEGLSNAISALAAVIKNLDLSGDNIFTNIPVIGPAIKYMADGSMAKDFENAFDKTFLSGFGGRGGVLEVRIPALEDIMGKFYTDFAASGVMAGKKDFRTIYDETTKAFEGATKTYTEEVPDTYINYQYLTGNIVEGFRWVTKQVALTWKTVERTVPMTSAEIAAKAEEAVRGTFEKILEGIDEETKSIIAETEKLNQENKTSLEAGVDTIKGVREVMQELEFGLTFLSSDKAEEARKQMEAFSKAQEEYFEALVGSEIREATEDLEDSILRIDRISTNLSEHAAKGLGAFEKQVDDFAKAIRLVSDPDKKKQLIENLNAFVSAFTKVSEATANEQIQDISLRGYDLTSEQELTVKYHKEMQDVLAQENLTIQDKKRVLLELNAAREREVAAMEREQELLNLRGAQSALAEILSTFEKTIEGINDLIQSLYDQVQDLLFGEFNLDPYLKKFELASDTYGTLLEAAFDPDATEDDIKKLQEFVNTYLGTARDLYKSSSTFQQIFSNVLSDLSVLGVQTGFNMPTAAVGDATSGIQEFIDATEDLSEELSETLNDLIFDLNDLGMAFAQQRIDLIQDELNIPLKITNDMIVVDLGDVNQTLTLTDENFTLDLTKLDLAASFEEITFTPNFGEVTEDTGWQDYEKSATFTASIIGWDPFAGRAAYSATATFSSETDTDPVKYGWTDYAQTASFSAILLNWGEYNAEATFVPEITLGEYTSEFIVYATLQRSFTRLGETAEDVEGFHTGYARLDLNLQGTMTTSSGSPKQYYGYASLTPSLSGMYTNSYYPHTGYASLSAYLSVDPYYFNKEITDTQNEINTKMNSFSLNSSNITGKIQTLQDQINAAISGFSLSSPSSGGSSSGGITDFSSAYSAGQYNWPRGGYSWYDDVSVNTASSSYRYAYVANSELGGLKLDIATMAYVLGQKAGASKMQGFTKYGVLLDQGSTTFLFAYPDDKQADAKNVYDLWARSGYRVEKYGFQKGGLVPGPMDTIPAMLAPGEYIMSQGAVDRLGIGTLNSLNAGDLSALRQTGDPEVRSLLRELIIAVKTSDTEVNVYTDMKGEAKAAIGEFRTELRERSRRQGEKYVNVRYV